MRGDEAEVSRAGQDKRRGDGGGARGSHCRHDVVCVCVGASGMNVADIKHVTVINPDTPCLIAQKGRCG